MRLKGTKMKAITTFLVLGLFFLSSCSTSAMSNASPTQTIAAAEHTGAAATDTPTLTFTPTPTLVPTPVLPVSIGTSYPSPRLAISTQNANQIKELARWGTPPIYRWIYSPDGKSLIGSSPVGIYIYDAKTLAQTRLISSDFPVAVVGYSKDGSILAAGSDGNTVLLWNATNGSAPLSLVGQDNQVGNLAISPDGSLLASSDYQTGHIWIWDTTTGKLIKTLNGRAGFSNGLLFSPDFSLLAQARGYSGGALVWDVASGSIVGTLTPDSVYVDAIAFSPDGKNVAVSYNNGTVHVWNASPSTSIGLFGDTEKPIYGMAYSPDGKLIAYGTVDGTVHILDTSTWKVLKTISVSSVNLFQLFFSPDGKTLATPYDKGIEFWDPSTGSSVSSLDWAGSSLSKASFSSDGKIVASGLLSSNTVELHDANSYGLLKSFDQYGDLDSYQYFEHSNVSLSPDGVMVAYGSEKGTIRVVNTKTGDVLQTLHGCGKIVYLVSFSPDGKLFACGGWNDGTIHIYKINGTNPWSQTTSITNSESWGFNQFVFSSDGQSLASLSTCGTLQVWDVSKGAVLYTLKRGNCSSFDPSNMEIAAAFSANGKLLASGSGNGAVRIWNLDSGTLLSTLTGHKSGIESSAFSPDGTVLASGSGLDESDITPNDYTIRLWNTTDGTSLNVLKGHNGIVQSLAFSPDGNLLISGSGDGTIRIWGMP